MDVERKIELIKKGKAVQYRIVQTDSAGHVCYSEEFDIEVATLRKKDEMSKTTYLHYFVEGKQRKVYQEVWEFMNIFLINKSENTRERIAYTLRPLLAYIYISRSEFQNWTRADIEGFGNFLCGFGVTQSETTRHRENETINNYYGTMRSYASFLGIHNSVLNSTKITRTLPGITDTPLSTDVQKYGYSKRLDHYVRSCPKFITADQYLTLDQLAEENNDKAMRIIMALGWQYGLRIGEVLGLTIEDVTDAVLQNSYEHVIILRNRLSDQPYQCCKNMLHPVRKEDYLASKAYEIEWTKNSMAISEELFQLIMEYISEAHSTTMQRDYSRYNRSEADIVCPDLFDGKRNHYIFLNSLGSRLSRHLLAKNLKYYFEKAGIGFDKGKRESNLFHRFRAGFCTHSLHVLKLQQIDVSRMMRHKSMDSILPYYNLTPEQELELKNELTKFIDSLGGPIENN